MYIIETEIRPSSIHGMGCFLRQPVTKDQVLWMFEPRFDLLFSKEEVYALPMTIQGIIEFYGYFDTQQFKGWWVFPTGNDRFTNHSDEPTVVPLKISECQYVMVASRDMEVGEELTCDYNEYENRLGIKLESEEE
jgi:SET domain-containing protein